MKLTFHKDRLFSDINRQNNILVTKQDKQKEPLFKTDLNKTLIQTLSKKDDDLKEDIDLSKELLDKVKQIKDDKKTQLQEEEITVDEIEDEIIEKIEIKKTDDKQIITSKDKYKFDQEKKAKLVIIIDDVVSKSQKQKILNIGYPITMAFLPPTKEKKESSKIAQDLAFYMVHFPLEASKNFKNFEDNTLNISDSYEKIESRVKQLRTWYPKAIYTNNHTGSIFTENYEAMDKLFRALIKYNFIFVDSKTTPNSVAKELSLKYKVPYIVRDVFLDNERNYTAIQNQLKEDLEYDQMSFVEYIDPFTGEPVRKNKK